jgi:hypothetical protein
MTQRRSAFVPRVIFQTIFVGVVPACAVTSCGGAVTAGGGGGDRSTTINGVGVAAFGGSAGVATGGFSVGASFAGNFGVGAGGFTGVGASAFGGAGGAEPSDASRDHQNQTSGSGGIQFVVAAIGFDASVADAGFVVRDGGVGAKDALPDTSNDGNGDHDS